MPKMLIMVHRPADLRLYCGIFKKALSEENVFTISSLDEIHKLPPDLDAIIVESNYGLHGSYQINTILLLSLLEKFPKALIVATSSTMASLEEAMNLNERITIMGAGNLKPKDCNENRVHSITSLKALLTSHLALLTAFDLNKKLKQEKVSEPIQEDHVSLALMNGPKK